MGKAQSYSVVYTCALSIAKPRTVFVDLEMVCGWHGGDDVVILGLGGWIASALGKCERTAFAGHCAWQHLGTTCAAYFFGSCALVYARSLAASALAVGTHWHFASDRFKCVFCDDGAQWLLGHAGVYFDGCVVAITQALALVGGGFAICTCCLDDGFIASISNQNLPSR